jgi:hypothetical protein
VKVGPEFRTFLFTHVDDILLFAPSGHRVDMHKILQRFEGNMFGEVKFFLGMNVARDRAARSIAVNRAVWSGDSYAASGATPSEEAAIPCSVESQNLSLGTITGSDV